MNAHLKLGPGVGPLIEKHILRPVVVTVTEFDEDGLGKFSEDMARAHETGQPVIPIVVDSFGGDAYALLGMLAIIDAASVPVVTVVESKAMSCGAILFTGGQQRYIAPSGTLMVHEVSSFIGGKNEDLKADVKETERLQELVFERMAVQCGKPKDYFEELVDKNKHADLYLDAHDAIRHGLATHIGIPSLITEIQVTHTVKVLTAHAPTREVKKTNTKKKRRAPS